MGYTLIDYFRAFHSLKQELKLSMSAQAVYFSLLGEFNAARFPKQLSLSDRELQALSGLKSVATAHDAKRILKNHKLIDFTSKRGSKGYTEYQLSTEHLPNNSRTITEQLPNNETNSYIRARVDLKTLDIKTNTSFIQSARTRETSELDNLLEYWEETIRGGRLSFEHQSLLSALLAEKGLDWLKEAMKEASDINTNPHGLSAKLLFGVIERKANPKPKANPLSQKGGEKSERPARIDYGEEPDYSWIK